MEQTPRHESIDSEAFAIQLADAVDACLAGWMLRLVEQCLSRAGITIDVAQRSSIEQRLVVAAAEAVARLRDFLDLDVDQQRSNPLAILRTSIAEPTKLLVELGASAPVRSEFDERVLPGDTYGLAPATWRDIDESLHEPGLMWGAWKAATVLQRRRDEGRLAND